MIQPGRAAGTGEQGCFLLLKAKLSGFSMEELSVAPALTHDVYKSDVASPADAKKTNIAIVGGASIIRSAIGQLLAKNGILVGALCDSEQSLAETLKKCEPQERCFGAILFVLSGTGPFGAFRRIHNTLSKVGNSSPLVVLSEHASRGQVYAALRMGAKGYVNMDAEPEELVKAIKMACRNKVYLAPDAAELLVKDISSTADINRSTRLPSVELSKREVEIVQLLCEGLSSKEIGRHLHISAKTVENHRYNIYRKSEVDSIAALMRHAIQHGLITL